MAGGVGERGVAVSYAGRNWDLAPGEVLTFGRARTCTVSLDDTDLGISRLAGSVTYDSGTWWVVNRSAQRPVTVADEFGIRAVVAPGRRVAVAGAMTVVIEGAARRHAIELVAEAPEGPAAEIVPAGDALPTATLDEFAVSDADRLALVAVFAGYLEPFPRYDPHPRSYADAAEEMDWPRTTLVKRIERLRMRLTDAGVPNLLGETALVHLAEWALTTQIITRADLALLRPGR